MKKIPYKHCYVVLQINSKIEKIFFENVINYKCHSNPDFDEHKSTMASVAAVKDECADKLFMLLVQSYLNSKKVINEFKQIAIKKSVTNKDASVLLVVDLHEFEDGSGSIQICTKAFNDKKSAFNYLGSHLNHSTMKRFVDSLSTEMQDELFDI